MTLKTTAWLIIAIVAALIVAALLSSCTHVKPDTRRGYRVDSVTKVCPYQFAPLDTETHRHLRSNKDTGTTILSISRSDIVRRSDDKRAEIWRLNTPILSLDSTRVPE